jgi:hypothetical protein
MWFYQPCWENKISHCLATVIGRTPMHVNTYIMIKRAVQDLSSYSSATHCGAYCTSNEALIFGELWQHEVEFRAKDGEGIR